MLSKPNNISSLIEDIEKAILRHLKEKTEEVAKKEIEELKKKIEGEISRYIDSIVLSIFSHFDVESYGHKIIITVDKRGLRGEKDGKGDA